MAGIDFNVGAENERENPDWMTSLEFGTSFDEIKTQALDVILSWYPHRHSRQLDLNRLEACVAIKNQDRAIVYQNAAFQHFFTSGQNSVGRGNESLTFWKTVQVSQKTDDLIFEGARSIDCEHIGKDSAGRYYTFRTFKSTFAELQDPDFFLFGVSRPIAILGTTEAEKGKSLSELFRLFQSLDDIDQSVCRLDAKGESTKVIAAGVGLTSKSIENRRNKMIALFGVQRPMDLIRITIRLEDHGLLPP